MNMIQSVYIDTYVRTETYFTEKAPKEALGLPPWSIIPACMIFVGSLFHKSSQTYRINSLRLGDIYVCVSANRSTCYPC